MPTLKRRMGVTTQIKVRRERAIGVAKSGAVWLTQEDLVVDDLSFLSQHPIMRKRL